MKLIKYLIISLTFSAISSIQAFEIQSKNNEIEKPAETKKQTILEKIKANPKMTAFILAATTAVVIGLGYGGKKLYEHRKKKPKNATTNNGKPTNNEHGKNESQNEEKDKPLSKELMEKIENTKKFIQDKKLFENMSKEDINFFHEFRMEKVKNAYKPNDIFIPGIIVHKINLKLYRQNMINPQKIQEEIAKVPTLTYEGWKKVFDDIEAEQSKNP